MKSFRIILVVMLVAAATLHAQIVNDGATNTLGNVTTNITGDVTVGNNGSFTLLILSDNALLTNSANGIIGLNSTAVTNQFGPGGNFAFTNPIAPGELERYFRLRTP